MISPEALGLKRKKTIVKKINSVVAGTTYTISLFEDAQGIQYIELKAHEKPYHIIIPVRELERILRETVGGQL